MASTLLARARVAGAAAAHARFFGLTARWWDATEKTTASALDAANKRITITRLLSREGETTEERRARLLFQSRKRGIKENDLIFRCAASRRPVSVGVLLTSSADRLRAARLRSCTWRGSARTSLRNTTAS